MTWSQIKWIAVAAMTIDHMASIFAHLFNDTYLLLIIHFMGRLAFPIFAYGIAQGCVYTHNRKKYLGRLAVFALVSEIPYRIAFNYEVLSIGLYNVLFTLFAGAVSCTIFHVCKMHHMTGISIFPISLILLIVEVIGTEYGAVGILCVLIPYLLIRKKEIAIIVLGFIMVFFYVIKDGFSGFSYPQFNWLLPGSSIWPYVRNALGAVTGVLLLNFYNGKKGSFKYKKFFYGYYPIHLLLLYLGRVMI